MRWLLLASLMLPALGCSTPMAQLRKELGPRVYEEFECPEDQVIFKELDRFISTTKVLARGCGKTATFVMVEGRWTKQREERLK